MGALINITDLFTSVETFDNPEVVKYIQEVRVGPLQAPVRVYRRNGYYIYEKGSGTNPKVVGLLNKYFSPSPYITPVHEDVFRPGVMVAEQFFPIRHKGEIVGVLAAVIDLHVLPGFFAQSNVNSEGLNLLILDRRDSLLFVDTFTRNVPRFRIILPEGPRVVILMKSGFRMSWANEPPTLHSCAKMAKLLS
jgi:hypothetical protein